MLLAIDVGNTNVVFALVQPGENGTFEVLHRWRLATEHNRSADEYMVNIHQLLMIAGLDKTVVKSAIIATVVPQTLFHLQRLCRNYFDVDAMVVGSPEVDLSLRINLPNPKEVGADRLVNAIAGHAAYKGDLIIVDFGTATTFDVVDNEGTYQGGVICPGINLSMDALFQAAAKLPRIAVEPPADNAGAIGKSTVHAMQSGVFFGYIGLIEGLVARITAEIGRPVTVIATGGLGVLFQRHTDAIQHIETDLTIQGLALIHARNTKATR
jgi:type III pantothenate kinase